MLPPALFPKTAVGFPAGEAESQGPVLGIVPLCSRPRFSQKPLLVFSLGRRIRRVLFRISVLYAAARGDCRNRNCRFGGMMCPQSSAGSDFFPFCWSGILAISYPRSRPFCGGGYLFRMCVVIFLRIGGKKAFFLIQPIPAVFSSLPAQDSERRFFHGFPSE